VKYSDCQASKFGIDLIDLGQPMEVSEQVNVAVWLSDQNKEDGPGGKSNLETEVPSELFLIQSR
jgi:hypothetical protein